MQYKKGPLHAKASQWALSCLFYVWRPSARLDQLPGAASRGLCQWYAGGSVWIKGGTREQIMKREAVSLPSCSQTGGIAYDGGRFALIRQMAAQDVAQDRMSFLRIADEDCIRTYDADVGGRLDVIEHQVPENGLPYKTVERAPAPSCLERAARALIPGIHGSVAQFVIGSLQQYAPKRTGAIAATKHLDNCAGTTRPDAAFGLNLAHPPDERLRSATGRKTARPGDKK